MNPRAFFWIAVALFIMFISIIIIDKNNESHKAYVKRLEQVQIDSCLRGNFVRAFLRSIQRPSEQDERIADVLFPITDCSIAIRKIPIGEQDAFINEVIAVAKSCSNQDLITCQTKVRKQLKEIEHHY